MGTLFGILVILAAIVLISRNRNVRDVSTTAQQAATAKVKQGKSLTFEEIAHRRSQQDIA